MQQLLVRSGYRAMTGDWVVFCGVITFSLSLVCLLCVRGEKGALCGYRSIPSSHHSSKQGTGLWQRPELHSWTSACGEAKMMGGEGCASVLTASSQLCAANAGRHFLRLPNKS